MRDKVVKTFISKVKHAPIKPLLYVKQILICSPKFTSTYPSKPLVHDSKIPKTPYDDQYIYNEIVFPGTPYNCRPVDVHEGVDGEGDGAIIFPNKEEYQQFHSIDNVTHDDDDAYDGDGGCDDIPRDEKAYGLHYYEEMIDNHHVGCSSRLHHSDSTTSRAFS
ncbi:hypothetical protein FNV43_RR04244 [Rhamnella rubrinervis]|uniref:Uncharacterized protein n=1 Tax=Rhamnella rubrinervis TaxID=2594499 RepID=A0A8K0MQ23_9ROSA|nr:hypothetical protein FNV43_RR04244 [Rhamnella rubrinervis]